jgi:hypothetical protein
MPAGKVRQRRRQSPAPLTGRDTLPTTAPGSSGPGELRPQPESVRRDLIILAVLTALAVATRFFRIANPPNVGTFLRVSASALLAGLPRVVVR